MIEELSPVTDTLEFVEISMAVEKEFGEASTRFKPFNSAHEGFAVLQEEVDELWDEVKLNQSKRDVEKLRKEAVQVAAMAMRFVYDICDGDKVRV